MEFYIANVIPEVGKGVRQGIFGIVQFLTLAILYVVINYYTDYSCIAC